MAMPGSIRHGFPTPLKIPYATIPGRSLLRAVYPEPNPRCLARAPPASRHDRTLRGTLDQIFAGGGYFRRLCFYHAGGTGFAGGIAVRVEHQRGGDDHAGPPLGCGQRTDAGHQPPGAGEDLVAASALVRANQDAILAYQ